MIYAVILCIRIQYVCVAIYIVLYTPLAAHVNWVGGGKKMFVDWILLPCYLLANHIISFFGGGLYGRYALHSTSVLIKRVFSAMFSLPLLKARRG